MMNIDQDRGRAVFISIVLLFDAPHSGSTESSTAIAKDKMRAKWPISAIIRRFLVFVHCCIAMVHAFSSWLL
ncbi:hypothetical protein OFO30_33715, partial [Escherichia coli]|nr:hypothetical protein [Escherichia coli]